jgi:hypothetical protein
MNKSVSRDFVDRLISSKDIFSLLPFGRRAGDEGLGEEMFFLIVLRERRVAFKNKNSKGATPSTSPHPNPLPKGEGDKESFSLGYRPTRNYFNPKPHDETAK